MVLCHTTLLSAELTLDLHLFKMNVETTRVQTFKAEDEQFIFLLSGKPAEAHHP